MNKYLHTRHKRLQVADKLIDMLLCYSVGASFLVEEDVKPVHEAYIKLLRIEKECVLLGGGVAAPAPQPRPHATSVETDQLRPPSLLSET